MGRRNEETEIKKAVAVDQQYSNDLVRTYGSFQKAFDIMVRMFKEKEVEAPIEIVKYVNLENQARI